MKPGDDWSDSDPVIEARSRRFMSWTALGYAVAVVLALVLLTYGLVRAALGLLHLLAGVD